MHKKLRLFFITSKTHLHPAKAFTIVELLVVIVVIGILASITLVSYANISNRATIASIQSDISNSSSQLKLYYAAYGSYPITMSGNCPITPIDDTNYCLKSSAGNTLAYSSISPMNFRIVSSKGNISYSATDATTTSITTSPNGSSIGIACPLGFIPVPGSGTYSTNDFCIMKYEASHSDATAGAQGSSTVPVSKQGVQQWVGLTQLDALAYAPTVAGCNGCHLTTEAEWMTVAQNVLSVASNWSGGTVGSGYIYSGHNDLAPDAALLTDASDSNGYAGETNTGGTQRRTLTLTNGEVIWDLAGNIQEWTQGVTNGTTDQQPGIVGESSAAWKQWTAITTQGNLSPSPLPASTGITGASSWNLTNGIGKINSNAGDTTLHAFIRGGYWKEGTSAGVLTLDLGFWPNITPAAVSLGFRVAK